MFSSLRTRLLTSYLLLLIVTLGGILLAFFVTTSNQPSPVEPTYQRLLALARGINLTDLILDFATQRGQRPQLSDPNIEVALLDNFAETRNVRVMVMVFARERNIVAYDSARNFEPQQDINLRRADYRPNTSGIILPENTDLIFGQFNDQDGDWLFSGVEDTTRNFGNQSRLRTAILVADMRPQQSLQSALGEFNQSLIVPLLQAGAVGLVIAVGMAYWISRTIAKPLQAAGRAATAVAEGDLNQAVPVSGPQEVRSVAEAFNTMSAEVRLTQQSQRDFMANVSHDLKTPLTSIQGYSQAIMEGATRDPLNAATIIHDEASRMTRMVDNLTDLARMEAGQLQMTMTPLNIGDLTTNVARNLTVNAQSKGVQLQVNVPALPPINGDGDRLVQVLNNLISNALKFTPAGGVVRVIARAVEDGVKISVADTGIGIPEKDLSRIFERFYQVDKVRPPERGTGLGLAITHEIVGAHGGTISVSSREEIGTTFTIWLPTLNARRSKMSTMTRPRVSLDEK